MTYKINKKYTQNYTDSILMIQELSESMPRDAASEGMKRLGGMGVWLA
jgi:hypothetical protein